MRHYIIATATKQGELYLMDFGTEEMRRKFIDSISDSGYKYRTLDITEDETNEGE